MESTLKKAYIGGGCFWCTEAVFKMLRGVSSVTPGYAGGHTDNPTYEQVSSGTTGHAETIEIVYDPALIAYEDLLTIFFASHDPTTLDRQGADVGSQYRSVIFYTDDSQSAAAHAFVDALNDSSKEGKPIVTQIVPFTKFYPAENYHKNYYAHHQDAPYCELVINPKLEKVQREFSQLLKREHIS